MLPNTARATASPTIIEGMKIAQNPNPINNGFGTMFVKDDTRSSIPTATITPNPEPIK